MRAQAVAGFVVGLSLLVGPEAVFGQSSITGVVRDGSGAVLPGVTVEAASPALIEKVRAAVTDGQGLYRIVDLRPGTYTVTFTLTGFSTLRREGLELPSEFTATVNAELSVGALEETVTVTGQAPIVDIRSSRAQVQFEQETLQALPGTGRLATLSSIIPGVTLRRESDRGVGGLSDRTQTAYSIHGAPEAQPVVDGMNHQIASLTSGVYVYNQIAIQEVVVETSGVGADRDTGGMQLNMVPRDGGNVFSGVATFAYVGPSLEMSNVNDELLARNLDPNRIGSLKKFRDSAAALGGPMRANRLWFFAAFREGVTQQFAEGIYYNKLKQPESLLYEPDSSRPVHSNDYSRDATLRLTWQAAAKHKVVASTSFQPNCNCVFNLLNPGVRRTPEAAGPHHYDPNTLVSYAWTYPATNRVLLEAGGSANIINQHDKREPGFPETNIQILDQGLNLMYGNIATRTLPRRQYQERFAVSHVTGSHSVKTGLSLRHVRIGDIDRLGHDLWMHNGSINYRFRNGVPNQVTITDAPWNFEESLRDVALYAQDQWTVRRLTLNLGLRYNDARASTPEQVLGVGFYVPERRFAPVDDVPHYRNLSARLGIAYDVSGTGRTALKASLGHYPDRVIQASANPAVNLTRNTNRNWTDTNRNFRPDCNLLNPAANGECGAWSNLNFGKANVETRYAADAQSGFNTQFHNWQGSVSVQHELREGLGLNVGYFRTWYGGFLATENLAVPASAYGSYCITAPVDRRLPGGGGNQICGLYDVNPVQFGLIDTVATRASQYGEQTQVYNGLDVTLTGRLADRGQFSGGLSMGRTVTDNCFLSENASLNNPTPTAAGLAFLNVPALPATSSVPRTSEYCHVAPPWSSGTQVKFMAVYPLVWGVQTSAIYQNSPGIPITASYVVNNAAIVPSLGRNLGSCRGAATCNANVTVELLPPNALFEPRLQQLDLRFSRAIPLGGTRRLRADIDVYNVFNASNVLSINTTYGPGWLDVRQILGGRLVRLGGQFDF
ncbi:MAG: TonB-dependent receptor [Acidobacteria bacterium]|nr:TonB-dependent receptor [Acidobacteriota bacterium]